MLLFTTFSIVLQNFVIFSSELFTIIKKLEGVTKIPVYKIFGTVSVSQWKKHIYIKQKIEEVKSMESSF